MIISRLAGNCETASELRREDAKVLKSCHLAPLIVSGAIDVKIRRSILRIFLLTCNIVPSNCERDCLTFEQTIVPILFRSS
jgi:hypothetical protein